MENTQAGLTGFQIKVFALIFMTFDHIHYMLTGIIDVPIAFTMIGRLAAPLFFFALATGMHHTRSRKKYVLRLYIGAVIVSLLNAFFDRTFPDPSGAVLMGNIFATMFLVGIYIIIGSHFKSAIHEKRTGHALLWGLAALVPLALSTLPLALMNVLPQNLYWVLMLVDSFLPSVFLVEGGIAWIILGLGLYLCNEKKWRVAIFYLFFCLLLFVLPNFLNGVSFLESIQWMMIFALPLMLLYNGKKGRGMKYFFYIYYPAHIYALLFVAHALHYFLS